MERISVDTKEVDNITEKIEDTTLNESTRTKVKDKDMIITDEVISIAKKDEIRNDVGRDSNINIKWRTKNIINKEDTGAIIDIENLSKNLTGEDFETANNQITSILSLLSDYVAIIQRLRQMKVMQT